jgi:hypothetical protein
LIVALTFVHLYSEKRLLFLAWKYDDFNAGHDFENASLKLKLLLFAKFYFKVLVAASILIPIALLYP